VLEACEATPNPVTISGLAANTRLAKSTVHRMCWKLEQLGFLDHCDGRVLDWDQGVGTLTSTTCGRWQCPA
jgi:DNA-binding IclR family transcriptional regulator